MSAPKPASVTVRKHEWHKAEKTTQTSKQNKIISLICKYFIQMLKYFFIAGAALVGNVEKKKYAKTALKKGAAIYRIAVCSGKLEWEMGSQDFCRAKGPLIWRALHTDLLNMIQTKQIVHLEWWPC